MSDQRKKPDEKGTNKSIEEVRVTGKHSAWQYQNGLGGWIRYYNPNSNIPQHMKADEFLEKRPDLDTRSRAQYLEEVNVYAKNLNAQVPWATIAALALRGGKFHPVLGRILDGAELIQLLNELKNEIESLDQDEVMDNVQQIQDRLDEIQVTAEKLNPVQSVFDTATSTYTGFGLEEVFVLAQNLSRKVNTKSAVSTITLDWSQVANMIQALPTGRTRVKLQNLELTQPLDETKAKPYRASDVAEEVYQSIATENLSGVLSATSTQTQLQIRNKVYNRTKTRYEENFLRKDKKAGRSASLYRGMLMLINKTYGEIDEVQDFMYAFLDNITVNGRKLSDMSLEKALEALKKGNYQVDWEQAGLDLAANYAEDKIIGRSSSLAREALNDMGYWGPNPGSYDTHLGRNP